jgi:beta-mannosidase
MRTQSLAGGWQFRQINIEPDNELVEWMPAQVPGGVHTDLVAIGKIPDPFVADHELDVQWVAQSDWEYRLIFSVTEDFLDADEIHLTCDGLDTLAKVYINEAFFGKAENMFRQYGKDVKSHLNEIENIIRIEFDSPVNYITDKNRNEPLPGVSQAIPGGPHLRKAPCQFGWDWGPMLPPIGIWKDIRLEAYNHAKIDDVHFRQVHSLSEITIQADFRIQNWFEETLDIQLVVATPDGVEVFQSETTSAKQGFLTIPIPNPQLWWPNGYGDQPLYDVTLFLRKGNAVLDHRLVKMGLRTIELRQYPDEWGKSFTFIVNGVPIFAKGSNWIPADSFPTRLTEEKLRHLIKSAVDSHQNMLRVWGGGFYEDELFYDLCDEYGVLVWQDMTFSCSVYPFGDEAFLKNVRHEIMQNVSRLRHRTSLALWCGNNEMEWGWESWGWKQKALPYRESYDRFFHSLLPTWITQLDPDRAYWPSSPSSNTPFENVNGQQVGDAHYWDVWHGRKPFTAYRDQYPRFMSEFGFQSLPPMETIKTYAGEADWNMTSYIMEHHQRSGSGNGLMIGQLTDAFRMPKDFMSLVYLSMVLQAEGIRYGVEHWRRNKHRVSGTLYWQLNDCWPVASWSSIDYFGRWKALHYAAKRFFAPVLLSIEDQDSLMDIYVTSDMNLPWSGTIRWKLIRLDGEVLQDGEAGIDVPALESCKVISKVFNLENKEKRNTAFIAELYSNDKPQVCLALNLATFCPNKHLELSKPKFDIKSMQADGSVVITLETDRLARFVEVRLDGWDVIFSDNYFDLPARMTKEVSFIAPEGLTKETLKERLKIRSLYDSFA